MLPLCAGQGKS